MLSYIFLPSQKAILLLIPYHFTIPPTLKNSIFIKILLFFLSLLFLFLGFATVFLFSLAPSTSSTNHKPQTQTQTQTHTNQKKSSPEPIWNPNTTGANHDHDPTTIWNPPEQTHSKKVIIEATEATTQPRPRPTLVADPRPTTPFSRRSTTNDPLHPNLPIHDHDPTTPIHNPQPTTMPIHNPQPRRSTTTTDPQPRRPTTHNEPNHDPQPLLSSGHSQKPQPEKEERKEMAFGYVERREQRWRNREEKEEREKYWEKKWGNKIYIYFF